MKRNLRSCILAYLRLCVATLVFLQALAHYERTCDIYNIKPDMRPIGIVVLEKIIENLQKQTMSKICPETNEKVLYLTCLECESKDKCRSIIKSRSAISGNDNGSGITPRPAIKAERPKT